MVKHIRTSSFGEEPNEVYTVYLDIDGVEYKISGVLPEDYRAYKKGLEFGEGYNALNLLKNRGYEVSRTRQRPSEQEKKEFSSLIDEFMLTHYGKTYR